MKTVFKRMFTGVVLAVMCVYFVSAVTGAAICSIDQNDYSVSYNANGESYGTDQAGAMAHIDLDLIRAVGTNGKQGYIRSSDYPELPKHLGDPLPSEQDLPLYTSDGITIIGVYHYGSGQTNESLN